MKRSLAIACSIALFILIVMAAPQQSRGDTAEAGTDWQGIPLPVVMTQPNPVWSVRTGYRKGIRDQTLPVEIFSGPDAAVLRNGAYAEWTGLLATFHESAALVGPGDLAGISRTKPYLIIPSDGLAGFSSSLFFRAGLAEYVRSGGVVLCFSQRRGSDLAALPVPEGTKLEAVGTNEDSGPVFRASYGRTVHPVLASLGRTIPSVETDGYLSALPTGAVVLLERRDNKPTLALYPFGKGWVVVASLESGRLYSQGLLDKAERILVRDLVLWAKAGGRPQVLSPGTRLHARIDLQGPELAASTTARVFVTGPGQEQPLDVRDFPIDVPQLSDAVLSYAYTLPQNIAPGIYHLEYGLIAGKKPLTTRVEASAGWFAVLPKALPPAAAPGQPVRTPDLRVSVLPSVELLGSRMRLHIELTRTAGTQRVYELLGRAGLQDIFFRMDGDRAMVTFDLSSAQQGPLSFAVYHVDGRELLKGTVPASLFTRAAIAPDRAWYGPGGTMTVRVHTGAAGSIRLSGLGAEEEKMVSGSGEFRLPLPQSLPTGLYPLSWTFQTARGAREEGSVPVEVLGNHLVCSGATVTTVADDDENRKLALAIDSSADMNVAVKLALTGPGGTVAPATEATIAVKKGVQDVSVPFSFRPSTAGIWEVAYILHTSLPEGPGFSRGPVELASGTVLLDAGDAAVLDVRTDPPLTYAPARPIRVLATAAGPAGTKVEVRLDGKKIARDKIGKAGTVSIDEKASNLSRGAHRITASLSGDSLDSLRETRFLSGALLPDLVTAIKSSGLKYPEMDVGVGITNNGRETSTATTASLYEGDPRSGGTLVRSFPVPPLEPGKQLVVIVPWPLAGKAGRKELFAVVNEDGSMFETSMENDRAQETVDVPAVLLSVTSAKTEYRADDPLDCRVRVANFSNAALRGLTVKLAVSDPTGRSRPLGTVALPDVEPGDQKFVDRILDISAPQEGTYLVSARLSAAGKAIADDSRALTVLPTLVIKGSLEGTADSTVPCRPFEIHSRTWDAGNVRPLTGTLQLDIRSKADGRVVLSRPLHFRLDRQSMKIKRLDLPPGQYTIGLRASLANKERGMTADMVLDERRLTVNNAVTVERSSGAFPRVLLWAGGAKAAPIERALIGKLVQEAFAQDPSYLVTVESAADFTARALTGMFTDLVVIDIDETGGAADAIRSGLERGYGVVIAGSGDRSRSLAETLGFRFEPLSGRGASSIAMPSSSMLGLTGTLPVTGATLVPEGKTANAVATFPDGRPAVVIDTVARGKVMVLPFSLTRSALDSGISTLYGRLLRAAVFATMPKDGIDDSTISQALTVSSPSGPVRTRIVEQLPPGGTLLWTNGDPSQNNGSFTFDLTADSDPKSIFSLIRPAASGPRNVSTEVFSECGGAFVSRGKVE